MGGVPPACRPVGLFPGFVLASVSGANEKMRNNRAIVLFRRLFSLFGASYFLFFFQLLCFSYEINPREDKQSNRHNE